MKLGIVIAAWLAVALLGANLWVGYQTLEQLSSDDTGPTPVAVDWANQGVVAVDIAAVSNATDEGLATGFIPVMNPWKETDDGAYDFISFRNVIENTVDTYVENTVDVRVENEVDVDISEPLAVEVWNLP